jgi:hypothetical protein
MVCVSAVYATAGCEQTVLLDKTTGDGGAVAGDASSADRADGTSPTDGGSGDTRCSGSQPQSLSFTAGTAETVIALDRSMAMNGAFGGTDSQLTTALNALSSVVSGSGYAPAPGEQHGSGKGNGNSIRFAFVDFPYAATDCSSAADCCSSDVTATLSLQSFNQVAYACSATSAACVDTANRPTAVALAKAHDFFSFSQPASDARYVLLVTDGPPAGGCSMSPNDCNAAIDEVNALRNISVETVIVQIGDGSSASCLLDMANAEGGQQAPYYYAVSSPDGLTQALGTISGSMGQSACHLDLANAASNPDQVTVSFNGTTVARDKTNGWQFAAGGSSQIALFGTACQDFLRSGGSGFTVNQGCSGRFGP